MKRRDKLCDTHSVDVMLVCQAALEEITSLSAMVFQPWSL